jgi:hypothetical protein
MVGPQVDILENTIRQHRDLLEILLMDRTQTRSNKVHNISWMTDSYFGHKPEDEIKIGDITGENTYVIQPRIAKTKEEQRARTRDKAEVFTPKEIVDEMNKQVDWVCGHWPVTTENWREYVLEKRLEITCGEAPFIVGRYNAANGKKVLKLSERVGFLDRKLQTISKYAKDKKEWLEWVFEAFKASYGYEWQGDNLLLARENLLYTFIDYWNDKFSSDRIDLERKVAVEKMKILIEIAKIISWNIFQMDGINNIIPMSGGKKEEKSDEIPPMLLLLREKKPKPKNKKPKDVKIMNWDKNKTVKFKDLG